MYKELLPENCPPAEATESELTLYRICIHSDSVPENFLPYSVLYPQDSRYKGNCSAMGISFFDKKETALKYSVKNPKLGGFIAEVQINPSHGKVKLTNIATGHYNIWLYNSFDISSVKCKIESISAN